MRTTRCAIYTRKSSDEGLEQEFNSLDAQREACAAYVASQKHEGWVLLPDLYDDGGLSGGTLDRPALQRLLTDIREGRVDQIVVYKIDRLTRSLTDFSKIVDILDSTEASFVSVTQSFNTATSMGRLTLNMLLSFAQFEREVTAERIRDKIAASKRKGLWMGGTVPLGYKSDGRTLLIVRDEAETIERLYTLYERLGTVRAVVDKARRLGLRSRRRIGSDGKVSGGIAFGRGHIHRLLTTPIYAGRVRHRDKVYEGQHAAIIAPDRWDRIQQQMQDGAAKVRARRTAARRSPLCGKLFDQTGDRLTPSHSRTKAGPRLRYYISHRLAARSGEDHYDAWRLPAEELERKVATIVARSIGEKNFAGTLIPDASVDQLRRAAAMLSALVEGAQDPLLELVSRIDISPGLLTLSLDASAIAATLNVDPGTIEPTLLISEHPFQLRKRGVESKIVFADVPNGRDDTLIRNIAKANAWLERIKAGETFSQIAEAEQTPKRRIGQLIHLAFLAPDIVRDVLDGTQPIGFTSDWCKTRELPTAWVDQRRLLATLQ